MSLTIGFEREYFLAHQGTTEPILVPKALGRYADECGWLVELRTVPVEINLNDPRDSLRRAIFEITIAEDNLKSEASARKYSLLQSDWENISKQMRVQARREHAKGLLSYRNLYGDKYLMGKGNLQPAGVHVSFKKTHHTTINPGTKEKFYYNPLWDFSLLFRSLDEEFAKEIKEAKRLRGCYELKSDLRIEYRSLPASISDTRLFEGLMLVFVNQGIRDLLY